MPSEIEAPALQGPPLSYDQRMVPVLASIATILPTPAARLQPNTTSLAALTAASERLPIGSLVVHNTAPFFRSSAAHPPETVVLPSFRVHGKAPAPPPAEGGPLLATATKMLLPSVAEPHCRPPVTPPGATWVIQDRAPVLRLKAQNRPLFCPAPTSPPPSSIGPCAKS